MRYLLLFGLVLMFSVAGFAQQAEDSGPGDQADDPIQAGFAIITPLPSSTTGGSLTVFATFGRKYDYGFEQAGILPPGLTTSAVLFVSASGRLSRNLGVAIVNPDPSAVAHITITLRNEAGMEVGTKNFDVSAHSQISKLVTELYAGPLPRDYTGTLSISSNNPIAVAALRFRGGNFSTLPVTNLSPSATPLPLIAGVGGPGAVLLPQFAAGGGWATEIVIGNTGTAPISVRVDLFKQDGTALVTTLNGTNGSTFSPLTIPAGGVLELAPRNHEGDDDF